MKGFIIKWAIIAALSLVSVGGCIAWYKWQIHKAKQEGIKETTVKFTHDIDFANANAAVSDFSRQWLSWFMSTVENSRLVDMFDAGVHARAANIAKAALPRPSSFPTIFPADCLAPQAIVDEFNRAIRPKSEPAK